MRVEEPASLCTTVTAYFPGMAWHFCKAHVVLGMQECYALFMWRCVILGDFLPYVQACWEGKHFAAAGVADTGWLFLWSLLDYYIYYMVGCVCWNQAQWSMNCHPLPWGIIGDSRNKVSAILENLGFLFPVSPVCCKSCCEFFSLSQAFRGVKRFAGLADLSGTQRY